MSHKTHIISNCDDCSDYIDWPYCTTKTRGQNRFAMCNSKHLIKIVRPFLHCRWIKLVEFLVIS